MLLLLVLLSKIPGSAFLSAFRRPESLGSLALRN
jgi:hypothetical protein